jgi:hypothetical protein
MILELLPEMFQQAEQRGRLREYVRKNFWRYSRNLPAALGLDESCYVFQLIHSAGEKLCPPVSVDTGGINQLAAINYYAISSATI